MGKYDMNIVKMNLKDLVSPSFNPRKISDSDFEMLKNSIKSYGYSDPLIVNKRNNHIVAGNQRYKALCELNQENHGKYTRIDVVLVDLPLEDEKAFNIGHNKIGGEFDEEKLESLLNELESINYDMALTGFMDEYEDYEVDMSDFVEDTNEIVNKPTVYMISVKCSDFNQMNYLFNRLKDKGYNVKSTQY